MNQPTVCIIMFFVAVADSPRDDGDLRSKFCLLYTSDAADE